MNDSKPATIGELFRDYHYCTNPVTKSVLMKCISERLDEMESLIATFGNIDELRELKNFKEKL